MLFTRPQLPIPKPFKPSEDVGGKKVFVTLSMQAGDRFYEVWWQGWCLLKRGKGWVLEDVPPHDCARFKVVSPPEYDPEFNTLKATLVPRTIRKKKREI